jgi:hypothetical protein
MIPNKIVRIFLFAILIIISAFITIHLCTHPSPRIDIKEIGHFRNDGNLYFLDIKSQDTLALINIEIVKTQDEISRGLMYRDRLAEEQGMLFIFNDIKERTFWMKNTRIPLDILFIDEKKEILYIAEHTTPYSTNPIPGFYPSKYVIEVNAGFCKLRKIKAGNLIEFN